MGLPVALSVIGRATLAADPGGTVAQAMNGSVPGVWVWEQSPGNVLASWASVRGASTFGTAAPKVYLDGIQLANPLLFSQFAPDAVERIEVIRGPQGAALYGADALSGVVNVVSRTEHMEAGAPRARLQSVLVMSQSTFAPGGTLRQEHTAGLRVGSDTRYAGLDLSAGGIGAFTPGAFNRHVIVSGTGRMVGPRTILTGTARFFAEDAGAAVSPVLRDAYTSAQSPAPLTLPSALDSAASPQAVREYTTGGTLVFMQNPRWTHSIVAGVDGYRLRGVVEPYSPVPSAADAALSAARGGADRGTLRVSSVARLGDPDHFATTLTFAGEQSILRTRMASLHYSSSSGSGTSSSSTGYDTPASVDWERNSAAVAQAQTAFDNSRVLTGGLRAQRDAVPGSPALVDVLPVRGAALVRDAGPVTIKLRAAYGRGSRPPQTPARETLWPTMRSQLASPTLTPERQSGVETGFDLLVGRALTLQVTRYDQRATGLIQPVGGLLPWDTIKSTWASNVSTQTLTYAYTPRTRYTLENVGAVANRGWEMQATTGFARLSLSGTLSYTDSRIMSIRDGYSGDLRPGDRVLEVPAWTGSLAASWSAPGWTASLVGFRAHDWVDYDRLQLAHDIAAGTVTARDLAGAGLRNYWRRYDGYTHVRASASHVLRRGLTLVATGDNLLNVQVGEPDNVTVIPGRTLSLGVRAAF